ncbi:MAG: P-loop NTPase fold protein, partial [Cyclobacteriaceae bacterium]
MNLTTFDNDLVGWKDFSVRLHEYIDVEHHFVKGSFVIALTAPFGSGKSTFINMWKDHLEKSDADSVPHLSVLNAWEADYCGAPLFALIHALLKAFPENSNLANQVRNAASDIGWFSSALLNQFVSHLTGLDPFAAGELAETKKENREKETFKRYDEFTEFEGRLEAMKKLKYCLASLINSDERQTVIIVDELDRCRPDYAINYLETINHIFDIQGLVFILAVDKEQLKSSAKVAFGSGLNFEEYFRKFANSQVALPPAKDESYSNITQKYIDEYFSVEMNNRYTMKLENINNKDICSLLTSFQLTLRQSQEVFRLISHLVSSKIKIERKLRGGYIPAVMLMAVLKVNDLPLFHELKSNSCSAKDIYDNFSKRMEKDDAIFWSMLC